MHNADEPLDRDLVNALDALDYPAARPVSVDAIIARARAAVASALAPCRGGCRCARGIRGGGAPRLADTTVGSLGVSRRRWCKRHSTNPEPDATSRGAAS